MAIGSARQFECVSGRKPGLLRHWLAYVCNALLPECVPEIVSCNAPYSRTTHHDLPKSLNFLGARVAPAEHALARETFVVILFQN